MRYIDPNIRLTIGNINFKAYLEDNSETYEIKETTLPFVALNDLNNSLITRVIQKVRFVFNVFAEDRKEAFDNYNNLKTLISTIKPTYYRVNAQYIPAAQNLYGSIYVKFTGMPLTRTGVNLQVYNFSYEVNKEIGYIQMPRSKKGYEKFYEAGNMELVPLAYKVTIEARLPNNIDGQANVINTDQPITQSTPTSTTAAQNAVAPTTNTVVATPSNGSLPSNGLSADENNILDRIVNSRFLTRKALERIDVQKKLEIISMINAMVTEGFLEKSTLGGVEGYESKITNYNKDNFNYALEAIKENAK